MVNERLSQESFVPPHKDTLNPGFAHRVKVVVGQLPKDLPLGALVYWDSRKRGQLVAMWESSNSGSAIIKASAVKQLPEAPEVWRAFEDSLSVGERTALNGALNRMLNMQEISERGVRKTYRRVFELDTSLSRVAEKISRIQIDKRSSKTDHFMKFVFADF